MEDPHKCSSHWTVSLTFLGRFSKLASEVWIVFQLRRPLSLWANLAPRKRICWMAWTEHIPQARSAFKSKAQQQSYDKEAEMSLLCFPPTKDFPLSRNSASAPIIKLEIQPKYIFQKNMSGNRQKSEVLPATPKVCSPQPLLHDASEKEPWLNLISSLFSKSAFLAH